MWTYNLNKISLSNRECIDILIMIIIEKQEMLIINGDFTILS